MTAIKTTQKEIYNIGDKQWTIYKTLCNLRNLIRGNYPLLNYFYNILAEHHKKHVLYKVLAHVGIEDNEAAAKEEIGMLKMATIMKGKIVRNQYN